MLGRLITVAILTAATARVAQGGATTPTLLVESARVTLASAGPRVATFDVAYDYSNAIQADYDLELIVYQGEAFVRFPVSGQPQTGTSAALANGLAVSDLPALDAAGTPAAAGVRVVALEPARVTVTLPAAFGPGSATVALVATVDEGPILSNPLDFVVPP